MSRSDLDEKVRSFTESVWTTLFSRLFTFIGIPLAAFFFSQAWSAVQTQTALLQALNVRMSVSETDRSALKDRVSALEMEMREIRRQLLGR